MIEKLASLLVLVPVLPLLAAAAIAVTKRPHRQRASTLAIGAMGLSCLIAVSAFLAIAGAPEERLVRNFDWLHIGNTTIQLGWMLDPLSAAMAAMVSFVGLLIFIFSKGYMAHDENYTRFFGFLALFGAAMLGLVIANSLLLLFICWELVGLASYLLIGFWFHKPEAAAAAKKAFITTRVGDMGLLLGMVWLHAATGTLTFYTEGGEGCLQAGALDSLGAAGLTARLIAPATLIALLLFCGAAGKSGQVPLHVWLPDAMEGPTPVSALIHAATMVAAGVFLMARVFPLLEVGAAMHGESHSVVTPALTVITWVGAFTALFAAFIAVAQNDIKRILAYSTVSQLGYMFLGLGAGGVAVGMFHLLTHAFFKALLFLGAGSVIHGCHEEQDIRYMGGVRRWMPVTFATYAVGMMALSGVPLFFSGFWSKDEILHAAHGWPVSHIPFLMGSLGAVLTAFYMTRQVCYVFFGPQRSREGADHGKAAHPHESPRVMTMPLVILATFAVGLGIFGTPAWPWAQSFLEGEHAHLAFGHLFSGEVLAVMGTSLVCVAFGIGAGWWFYGRQPISSAARPDVLEERFTPVFVALKNRLYVDELYEATVIRFNALAARFFDVVDRWILGGAVAVIGYLVVGFAWIGRFLEDHGVNAGFDLGCRGIRRGAGAGAALQDGRVHNYLRALGIGFATLLLLMTWGCH